MRCAACNNILTSADMGRKDKNNNYLWLCRKCYGYVTKYEPESIDVEEIEEDNKQVDNDQTSIYHHDTEYDLPDDLDFDDS